MEALGNCPGDGMSLGFASRLTSNFQVPTRAHPTCMTPVATLPHHRALDTDMSLWTHAEPRPPYENASSHPISSHLI